MTLRFNKPPAKPAAFTIDDPARIALDFPNTITKLPWKNKAINLGLASSVQWLVAAAVGAGATAAWHLKRAQAPRSAPIEHNADANLDIGETVQVDAWAADGSARVQYRGSSWAVRFAGSGLPLPGLHTIVSVQSGHLGVATLAAGSSAR